MLNWVWLSVSNFVNERVYLLIALLGAELNEKVQLFLNSQLVESKTFPHLISAGIWTDFWLQIRRGTFIIGMLEQTYFFMFL